MKKLVYPGSFDPITLGHVDIINRAAVFCDELIVAVLVNSEKKPTFSLEERVDMINKCIKNVKNVKVQGFDGLLAEFTKKVGSKAIIKGLRAVSDYEYELQMAHINKKLNNEMETLFMMASVQYSFLSSSTIKDIARFGGDISDFLPSEIVTDVESKFRGNNMEFLELIDELQEYIENSSNLPLSSKCVIDKFEAIETIKEIKKKIPEEMNKAKWVIKERERILKDAQQEAEDMLKNSGKQLMKLIDEHEITKNARIKAQETIKEMQIKKAEINSSLRDYASSMLKELETTLEKSLLQVKDNIKEIEKNKK